MAMCFRSSSSTLGSASTHATDGSGGLYSTGNDMAVWRCHNLMQYDTLAMSHAVYLQRQSLSAATGFDEGAPMSGLALAWVHLAGNGAQPALLRKSGEGVGFMSYMAFAPGRNAGVLVILNRTDFGIFAPLVGAANSRIGTLATCSLRLDFAGFELNVLLPIPQLTQDRQNQG
jgi:D-alanyl-D-alanine-carboxypeptidase/D-alanyl-D-alanine-endopeptidase